MKITLHTITVGELIGGFENNDEQGVVGYGGRLNIRPAYQREFIYNEQQQKEVINTIFNNFPLNVMYWVRTPGTKDHYELLDGQQRTLSICSYCAGEFFTIVDESLRSYDNLTDSQRKRLLSYELQVYICEDGTAEEQLAWFRIINIAGERLTDQELRNAIYTGPWVTAAKSRFSKKTCVAAKLGKDYMSGEPIRQHYLERVIAWMADAEYLKAGAKERDKDPISTYMANHQHDANADREWQYFQRVVAWVQSLFPKYRKEMKGLNWGLLYNRYRDTEHTATELEQEVARLMMDDDVTAKRGIYDYVLSGNERSLSIRAFSDKMRRAAFERQNGICPKCGGHFDISEMEADHITPWSQGGPTTADNCQMLCRECNRRKSDK